MADDRDNETAEQAADAPRGPQCGERLAAARAERDISVSDIAKELHISEDKVDALERNEFDTLGAAVFARGYIRKYAQLMGLDEAELAAEYDSLASDSNILPELKARPRPRREMSPGPWIVLIVIIILAASAYWWFVERPVGEISATPPAEPGTSIPAAQPTTAQPAAAEPATVQRDSGQPTDAAPVDAVAGTVVDDVSQAAAEEIDAPDMADEAGDQVAVEPESPEDGQLRLLLTFSGDCWTEISDGTGRRLFFGLGSDGRTVELSGQAPINALFGNADSVRIEVNGVAYAIRPEERRGRTARLTIAGP